MNSKKSTDQCSNLQLILTLYNEISLEIFGTQHFRSARFFHLDIRVVYLDRVFDMAPTLR